MKPRRYESDATEFTQCHEAAWDGPIRSVLRVFLVVLEFIQNAQLQVVHAGQQRCELLPVQIGEQTLANIVDIDHEPEDGERRLTARAGPEYANHADVMAGGRVVLDGGVVPLRHARERFAIEHTPDRRISIEGCQRGWLAAASRWGPSGIGASIEEDHFIRRNRVAQAVPKTESRDLGILGEPVAKRVGHEIDPAGTELGLIDRTERLDRSTQRARDRGRQQRGCALRGAADHHLGLVPKRRDRSVLKIDHEDRRSEERRDDEEYQLRLAIGESRKALHQSRTLAVVTGAVKRRFPGVAWH